MKSGLVGSVWVFLLIVFTKDLFANKDKMPVTFSFPEYQYKETPKNAIAFREYETACEQSRACSRAVVGIQKIKCIRECMSSACYREIYSRDPLEEGEIDVRLNSFKGCFIQKSGRLRT